jgi:hypothetical protein
MHLKFYVWYLIDYYFKCVILTLPPSQLSCNYIYIYIFIHSFIQSSSVALRSVQGPGLPHNSPPLFSILCYIPPSLTMSYLEIHIVLVERSGYIVWASQLDKKFLRCRVISLTPKPQPGGPGYPFLSGSSPLTCPAWETLPVATLPPS